MSARPESRHPLIRKLWPEDIDALVRIEEASYPWPWSRGIFNDCLRVGYACFGLQHGSDLVGYAIHNQGAGECHLLNLCVSPQWLGHGFGSMLLEHTITHAQNLGCEVIFLEVRPSNTGATRLYQRRGFEAIGVRPAYYRSDNGREDAVVMRMELPGEA